MQRPVTMQSWSRLIGQSGTGVNAIRRIAAEGQGLHHLGVSDGPIWEFPMAPPAVARGSRTRSPCCAYCASKADVLGRKDG